LIPTGFNVIIKSRFLFKINFDDFFSNMLRSKLNNMLYIAKRKEATAGIAIHKIDKFVMFP